MPDVRIKKYFDIKEVVCKHVYNKFRESAWQFFDPRLLETMLVIREKLGKPIYVNNWDSGGNLTQRGLRCNVCQLVKEETDLEKVYMSAHMQGSGWDFNVKGQTPEETRGWIIKNQILLPHPIRLEDGVAWVHLDTRTNGSKGKVVLFRA